MNRISILNHSILNHCKYTSYIYKKNYNQFGINVKEYKFNAMCTRMCTLHARISSTDEFVKYQIW